MAMRIIAILLVMMSWRVAGAEGRAKTIAASLELDPARTAKVASTLRTYDGEILRLRDQRAELRRKMIEPAADAQKLLDESVANARLLVVADELLVSELRTTLTPEQTVRVLVLLSASEPDAAPCDPFKQMHRCPVLARADR
jgi:hypothetical protein